jgi:hypothetical protein
MSSGLTCGLIVCMCNFEHHNWIQHAFHSKVCCTHSYHTNYCGLFSNPKPVEMICSIYYNLLGYCFLWSTQSKGERHVTLGLIEWSAACPTGSGTKQALHQAPQNKGITITCSKWLAFWYHWKL